MELMNLWQIISMLSLIYVAVNVESVGNEELQMMERYLTENVKFNKPHWLSFIALSKLLNLLQKDPTQKHSRLAKYVIEFKGLCLNSYERTPACSWIYFIELKDFKTAAKFKYNWKDPDQSVPRMSELLLNTAQKVAKNCADHLKLAYKKKVNSWHFSKLKLKRAAKLIDELIKQVTEDVNEEYGKCSSQNCRLVDRIHSISNNDYQVQSMFIYRGIFNLGKKLGKLFGEWPKNERAQVNSILLEKVTFKHHTYPCYVFTSFHMKYIQPMVDYAYIVGRPDQSDKPKFYRDLDRFEFCHLLLS